MARPVRMAGSIIAPADSLASGCGAAHAWQHAQLYWPSNPQLVMISPSHTTAEAAPPPKACHRGDRRGRRRGGPACPVEKKSAERVGERRRTSADVGSGGNALPNR